MTTSNSLKTTVGQLATNMSSFGRQLEGSSTNFDRAAQRADKILSGSSQAAATAVVDAIKKAKEATDRATEAVSNAAKTSTDYASRTV